MPSPKNERKPITSVIVVTNTLEAIAGSMLNFLRDFEILMIMFLYDIDNLLSEY